MSILIVDDDPNVLASIIQIFEDELTQYRILTAANGQQALDLIAKSEVDLIVLDIMMPELDGVEVCRRIRSDPYFARVPILFLTAKGRSQDIALGLDAGGDDYLVKPFDVIELPARVRALLRRSPGGVLDVATEEVKIGNLRIFLKRGDAEIAGQAIPLTPIEHRILYYLVLHRGHPVTIDQLLEDIWGYAPGAGDPQLVRVHITNLRNKIGVDQDAPEYIHNVHGRGYMLHD
jgi:DNA-binding response OmpR family regulator